MDYENLKFRADFTSPKSIELALHDRFKNIYSHSD